MLRIARLIAVGSLLAIPAVATAQAEKKATPAPIYDEKADAKEQVKAATALAHRDARRVLVMFGYNQCGWCHRLHALFKSDAQIRRTLADEYVVVLVDIKSPNADDLLDASKAALSPEEFKKGVGFPFLSVLDGEGKIVTSQRTDPLEEGNHHDPAKVKEFLAKWTAPKASAPAVLDVALAKASSEDRRVFLHFGSPTCGWCHKLEAFLAREDIAPLIGKEFVDVKVDLARMTDAEDVLARYNAGKSGGVPWFVFTDPKGTALVTSDGPKGNIGYPATAEEINHFVGMLRKVARKLTPADIDRIEAELKAEGRKIEAARNGSP